MTDRSIGLGGDEMTGAAGGRGWVVPVFGLLLAAFAVCTAELVLTAILPPIARDMGVDIPTAGLLVTGYAVGVGLAGPLLSLVTNSIPRRTLLLVIMGVFVVGCVGCALAPNYALLLAARLLMAACHGLFFGVSMLLATRLAPPGRQATALSLVMAGVNAATIAGIPLGAAIGNAYGWRTSFWIIAGLAALAGVALMLLIPKAKEERAAKSDFGAELRAVMRPAVLICFTSIALTMMGIFALVTYLVPLLTGPAGIPIEVVPWTLFLMGLAGFIGNLAAGRLADRNPVATMLIGVGGCIVSLVVLTQIVSIGWLAVVVLAVFQFCGFMFPAPAQARILKEIADAPNFGSTLISTAFQVGIAIGAATGAAAIASGWSFGQLPWLSALFYGLGLIGVLGLLAYDRRLKVKPASA